MITFRDILERELNLRQKDEKIPAKVTSLIQLKGVDLQATFDVVLDEEITDDSSIVDRTANAALNRVSDILDNAISIDILDSRVLTKKQVIHNYGLVNIPNKATGLRDTSGRFLSAQNLARLLNLILYRKVKELMNRPRLVYRTGRFARSAHINAIRFLKKVDTQRKNRISIFFSYMLYPYAVFESHSTRDPRKIIEKAIQNGLKEVLNADSYKNNIFNIRRD